MSFPLPFEQPPKPEADQLGQKLGNPPLRTQELEQFKEEQQQTLEKQPEGKAVPADNADGKPAKEDEEKKCKKCRRQASRDPFPLKHEHEHEHEPSHAHCPWCEEEAAERD